MNKLFVVDVFNVNGTFDSEFRVVAESESVARAIVRKKIPLFSTIKAAHFVRNTTTPVGILEVNYYEVNCYNN